ncbi:hypothetical protein ETAA8_60420 [Anatilimnocola aggregata]|uniref:Uncharacterized protein n=1 Tax=Anatilimnocola aggregata TaxID=2528021 RepID=A0A517YL05_9BACT|nr:hypothetical protein [Anatilimnocola aggregata]QDU30893.1 hypothetical protein ETAA8_60420 [Anatilimnocola aggregata]
MLKTHLSPVFDGLLWVSMFSCLTLTAQGPEQLAQAADYRELVAGLASPNKNATTTHGGEPHVRFPAGYDVEAQRRIDQTRKELQENFEAALPFLVEALDDKRYCMTVSWAEGDAYYNYSVGAICRDIIASQLEVYRNKIRFSDAPHWNRYNYPLISKQQMKKRDGRRLAELQVEAIDWAINKLDAAGNRQNDDDKTAVAELKKLRTDILESGIPAKPNRLLRPVFRDR